ncbi:MAG: phage tail protein I [Sterolibacterium sp.]|nr:phage tail protein I [Sterolibacterium sp.]
MSDYVSLLPPNATFLERAVEQSSGITTLPVPIGDLWNPATCPLASLPWLAWALSVDEWDQTWPEATQRAVVAAAIEIHRRKGTVGAVRQAVVVTGRQAALVEWWQMTPPGPTHTFRADIEIEDRGIGIAELETMERQVRAAKPARSHFSTRLIGRSSASVLVGIGGQDWGTTTVYPQ